MQGLGNTKNEIARRRMREDGVDVDEGSVRFVRTGWGSTPGLARLAFGLLAAGRTLRMEISHTKAAYTLGGGEPLQIIRQGQPVTAPAPPPG